MQFDPTVQILGCLSLSALLIVAAIHKLLEPAAFRGTLTAYRLLPAAMVALIGPLVPLTELAAGAALLYPEDRTRAAALSVGAVLLSVYAAAMAVNILRGNRSIDCGCLGFGARRPRLTWVLVARNLVIALMASALAVVQPGERLLLWFDWVSIAGGFATMCLLYASLDLILTLPSSEIVP
jgi:hypothetical protein